MPNSTIQNEQQELERVAAFYAHINLMHLFEVNRKDSQVVGDLQRIHALMLFELGGMPACEKAYQDAYSEGNKS